MLPYTQAHEFRDRYIESIIYYDGEPVYVVDVTPHDNPTSTRASLHYRALPYGAKGERGEIFNKPANDPLWTETPIHVGYVADLDTVDPDRGRYLKTSWYAMRVPVRRSKQGLFHENLLVPRESGYGFSSLLATPGLKNMLKSRYSDYISVSKAIKSNRDLKVCAFHKNFALEYTSLEQYCLHYKGKRVAQGPDLNSMKLPSHFQYLREAAEDVGVRLIA